MMLPKSSLMMELKKLHSDGTKKSSLIATKKFP